MAQEPLKICKNCGRQFLSPEDFLRNTSRWRICGSGHLWFNCQCHSTNMILKGKFAWYDPEKQLSAQARSIFNQVPGIKDLPRIPAQVMELQTMIEDPNTDAVHLANVAKKDPLLAAQILKVANQQSHGNHISSLSHAISFLGINPLKDLILVASISRIELKTKVFKPDAFWNHSFLIGRCAEFLTERFRLPFSADQAYIAGCICNVGKVVLAICAAEAADRYARDLEDLSILGSWSAAEKRHQGYQHTVLGEIGAVFWGFSEDLMNAIALHHKAPSASQEHKPIELYELVALANQMSHWVALEPHQMDSILFQGLCQRFGIKKEEVEQLVDEMLHLRMHAA